MEKVLHVQSVNDYARHVGAPILHPLVSVIHYDELESCRHALSEYGVYGLFLMKESPYTISYGSGNYRFESGSLMCVGPGQRGGVTDNGEIIHIKGWVLLFHPDFLIGTPLERRIREYHYFSYYSNEALILTP
nr:AraC family transcriptional regulator [Bacteroidales bacterium]